MEAWIPDQPGLLPKWILFIGAVSLFNTVQTTLSPTLTRRVYPLAQPTASPLAARLFGTYTLLTGIVRLFGAYRLDERAWYDLTLATFAVALWHFGGELLVWRTTRPVSGATPTFFVAVGTTLWMGLQRGSYLGYA